MQPSLNMQRSLRPPFITIFVGFLLHGFCPVSEICKKPDVALSSWSWMTMNTLYHRGKKIQPQRNWDLHYNLNSPLFCSSSRNCSSEVFEYWDNKTWNTRASCTQTGNKCFISLKEQVEAFIDLSHSVSQQKMEHSGSLTGREIVIPSNSNHSGCLSSVDLCIHPRPKTISQPCLGNYPCHQLASSVAPQMSDDSFLLMALTRKNPSKVPFLSKRKKLQKLLSMKVQMSNASVVKASVLEKSNLANYTGPQVTDTSPSSGWGTLSRDLTDYLVDKHAKASRQSHRHVRDCQPKKYGNATHETQTSHGVLSPDITLPITTVSHFMDDFNNQWGVPESNNGHFTVVNNPAKTLSVLEPLTEGGCDKTYRASVVEMGKKHDCLIAVNAGFFNTHTGDCFGNIVSDGRFVKNSHGIQNAHFGIRKDGTLVFGYLTEDDVLDTTNPFIQLIGGVGWMIRDGKNYLEESVKAECEDTEETGTVEHFFSVKSARTIIGSDSLGRIILAQVDGQTSHSGVSLDQMTTWLLEHGVVNAINLDGGGSATYVVNGSLANYPSDKCSDHNFRCARQVSTIICVHKPQCTPPDCSGHGECVLGKCRCEGNWEGSECSTLVCGTSNCSSNGRCTEGGCECNAGFRPPDCSRQCLPLQYGPNCQNKCLCQNGGYCEPVTGECICIPGYTGEFCEQVCPYGTYGPQCKEQCDCFLESCPCHHVTGSCSLQQNESFWTPVMSAGQCLANREIKRQHLVPYIPLQENMFFLSSLVVSALLFVSLVCNIVLFCFKCSCHCSSSSPLLGSSNRGYRRLELDDSDGL